MSFKNTIAAGFAAALLAPAAFAGDAVSGITVKDAYARVSTAQSKSGAAFMSLMNHGDKDDRLIGAASDVAERVELHTHTEDENGVMKMTEIDGGIAVPAEGMHQLKRGGDHVMLMGLKRPLADGDIVELTLTFETAGEVVLSVPVDLRRKPAAGSHSGHGTDG